MICFAWSGFPQYAARCVGAFVEETREEVCVVATRPDVPVCGMEELAKCPVHWINAHGGADIPTPQVLVVSGWYIPAFNLLAERVRANGGKVIAMNDGNFVFSMKEILRTIRFRLLLKRKFDAFFVPGRAGIRLMRFYGVPRDKIFTGMYTADSTIFYDGLPLGERAKRIVYVGRFNQRKNVLRMCDAFLKAGGDKLGWTLALYGNGELKEAIPKAPSIEIHDFVQPEQLGEVYRNARCFVLASLEEHWGVVVHEAALSGCFLLVSRCVGAAEDFVGKRNGILFNPLSVGALTRSFEKVFSMDDNYLKKAQEESLQMGGLTGLKSFVTGIKCAISLST